MNDFHQHRFSFVEARKALSDLSYDQMARALYVGFDIKLTPEEQVREYYSSWDGMNSTVSHERRRAVYDTLKILGIKIKGIND